MDNASNQTDSPEQFGFVVRKGRKGYHIAGLEDLSLNKRELIIFLAQQSATVEDIGLMFTYFDFDKANEAHFGMLGEFIFATNYILPRH